MEETLNVVNATQEPNVEAQTTTQETGVNNPQAAEVETAQTTQSPEENAQFAKIRREAETRAKETAQKAVDAEYDRLYGSEYGIHSKAEYEAKLAQQKAEQERLQYKEEHGIDPDAIKPLFEKWKESDPDFQELKKIKVESTLNQHLSELNKDFPELNLKNIEDLVKLPNFDQINGYVQRGMNVVEAYKLANYSDIISKQTTKAQQEAIQKMTANASSTPGSLAEGGENIFFTKEQVKKMSPEEVNKNYEKVIKSMKEWNK